MNFATSVAWMLDVDVPQRSRHGIFGSQDGVTGRCTRICRNLTGLP